jgi:hypothetical protein
MYPLPDMMDFTAKASRQPTFVVSSHLQLSTLAHPPLPCLGARIVWRVRNPRPNPTPPPSRGRGATAHQRRPGDTTPPPPSRLPLWGHRPVSWWVGMQQLNSPPPCSPSRSVPTWADIVRGEPWTQGEASAVSPAEIIAIYQRCAAAGVQAHFYVKNLAGFEEVCLICRFTDTAAPRPPPA